MGAVRAAREEPFFHPLLPVQWRDRVSAHVAQSPEKRLMLAVLADAIVQLHRGSVARAAEEDWILATDDASPFAFTNICDVLGLDAASFARRLLASPPTPLPSLRQRRGFHPHITSQRSRRSNKRPIALPPMEL